VIRRVAVVDYGRGNLFSVARALELAGVEPYMADTPETIRNAEAIIRPGVGAFGDALAALECADLTEGIAAYTKSGRPFLGICLGAQLLFDLSRELGEHHGLGLIPGTVERLTPADRTAGPKVPNVGWARLQRPAGRTWTGTILDTTAEGEYAYFVHSYHAVPTNDSHVLAHQVFDGSPSAAVVARDNVIGCQFHPEKSGEAGQRMLAAWLKT
jgi:glutamine amidotransferase